MTQRPLVLLMLAGCLACGDPPAEPTVADPGNATASAPAAEPEAVVESTAEPAAEPASEPDPEAPNVQDKARAPVASWPVTLDADGRIPPPELPVDLTADAPTVVVEGLLNGGFELIADSSTTPPKYGAYWLGAFAPDEGDATDLIEERSDAPEGERVLVLRPGDPPVVQKIVADPRWAHDIEISLSRKHVAGGNLVTRIIDGRGRVGESASFDFAGSQDRWTRSEDFVVEHDAFRDGATPRLLLELSCDGPAGGTVEIDEVSVRVHMPAVSAEQLADTIGDLVRWQLELWTTPRDQGGLGLVDPHTGYVIADGYDVTTGDGARRTKAVSFHSLHVLLTQWLEIAHAEGWDTEVERWTPWLVRIVETMLERHVHPATGLPFNRRLADGTPMHDQPQTVGAFLEFLLSARPLLPDAALRERTLTAARRMADALLQLQASHDKDPATVRNVARVDQRTGVFEGTWPNWFGHMPNRFTPKGELDTPRRFNTAWAVVKQRSFWYHLLHSPAAVMAVHAERPRPTDLRGVARALSLYHRDWDAARYDLENDTDDHYGYHAHDMLWLLESTAGLPSSEPLDAVRARALELLLAATDHRLPRDQPLDEALWIQAIRLGTACAGDSPRAFEGLLGLHDLPDTISPTTSGLALYREAILELAANDFKGRQLTNGQFTESFFKHWEMVCICYHGTYQGDCRERPLDQWHGDVGDIFGGPPRKTIEAQAWALAVAEPEQRAEILGRLGTILAVTENGLRRRFGYMYGLDPEVARQYELPDKYIIGLTANTSAGFGYVMSWLEALPHVLAAR